MAAASKPYVAWSRQLRIGAGVVGSPTVARLVDPVLGYIVIAVELALVLAIILSAMYGSTRISNRAFRVIRLFLNRPEPPARSKI
jgi:hypothetical protein